MMKRLNQQAGLARRVAVFVATLATLLTLVLATPLLTTRAEARDHHTGHHLRQKMHNKGHRMRNKMHRAGHRTRAAMHRTGRRIHRAVYGH